MVCDPHESQSIPITADRTPPAGKCETLVRARAGDVETMRILVGTPAYDKSVTTIYLASLLQMLDHFRERRPDIQFRVLTVSTALVTHARNVCASMVLQETSYSHLLFIDSDMGFSPSLIEKMINFDRPLTGCVYPRRSLDYRLYHAMSRKVDDPDLARHLAQDYIGGSFMEAEPNPGAAAGGRKVHRLQKGFARVRRAGTGIMLVKREVFGAIRKRYPELWVEKGGAYYEQMGLKGGVLQCFECYAGRDGLYVGEDFAFCDRWVKGCGGEIWACVNEDISHYGRQEFTGRYLTKLQSVPQTTPASATAPGNGDAIEGHGAADHEIAPG